MLWFAGPLLQTHFEIKYTYMANINRPSMQQNNENSKPNIITIYWAYLLELLFYFKSIDAWRTVIFVSRF